MDGERRKGTFKCRNINRIVTVNVDKINIICQNSVMWQ